MTSFEIEPQMHLPQGVRSGALRTIFRWSSITLVYNLYLTNSLIFKKKYNFVPVVMKQYKDDELRKQAAAWSRITCLVSRNASIGNKRVPYWRLEAIFKCGDGTGRLWRCWMNGDRLARDYTRLNIVSKAQELGWLVLDGIANEITQLPDEIIQALTAQLPGELIALPAPPTEENYKSARLIVNALLSDARSKNGVPETRENEFLGAKKYRDWSASPENSKKFRAWDTAAKELRLAICDSDGNVKNHELRILRARLVCRYRLAGFV